MDGLFHLRIVTIDRELVDAKVRSFTTRDRNGEFQILPDHSPLIALTVPSRSVYVDEDGATHVLFTSKGVLKLNKNDLLLIVDSGELQAEIDRKRAQDSLERAEDRLKNKKNIDVPRAEDSLARAKMRIAAADTSGR